MQPALDPDRVSGSLRGAFGSPLRYLPEVASTNTEASTWARAGAPEGAVVVTDHQTAGRGRWGRAWASEAGKLLQFSLVLRPGLALSHAGLLATAAGVGVARGLASATGLDLSVKWPNDVLVGGRKVCGMLIETESGDAAVEIAIVGIGINTGWAADEVPLELRDRATSLAIETGRDVVREDVLVEVLAGIERAYETVRSDPERLVADAAALSSVLGRNVTVRFADGTRLEGAATRLDGTGSLVVATEGGERVIALGEVERVREV